MKLPEQLPAEHIDKIVEKISSAINRWESKDGDGKEYQLCFCYENPIEKPDEIAFYKVKDFTEFTAIKFKEILNVPLDALGVGYIAQPILKACIRDWAAELGINPMNVRIYVHTFKGSQLGGQYFGSVYENAKYLKTMPILELLKNQIISDDL